MKQPIKRRRHFPIAAVCVLTLLCTSCMERYREETYTSAVSRHEWGNIMAFIQPDRRKEKGIRLQASPYDIRVSVRMKTQSEGEIVVTELELVDVETGETTYSHATPLSDTFEGGGKIAGIVIEKVPLPYRDYRLRCNVEIRTDSELIHKAFDQSLIRDFDEGRRLIGPTA